MKKELTLGVSSFWSKLFVLTCVAGIIAGSWYDYSLSVAIATGPTLAMINWSYYVGFVAYALWVIGGALVATGLGALDSGRWKTAGFAVLVFQIFMATWSSIQYCSTPLYQLFGVNPGDGLGGLAICAFWILIYSVFALIIMRWLRSDDPAKLVKTGLIIVIGAVVILYLREFLKQLASRPRYYYLLTLPRAQAEYRHWWQWAPWLGDKSIYASWPSGHIMHNGVAICLPMLADCIRTQHPRFWRCVFFLIAISIIAGFGYIRIVIQAHFLTDICWGALLTWWVYATIEKLTRPILTRH